MLWLVIAWLAVNALVWFAMLVNHARKTRDRRTLQRRLWEIESAAYTPN